MIFNTDLLPHLRGRRRDPRDVLETSGSEHFHHFLSGIKVVHGIDECSGDEVRQMADGSGRIVMLPVV